MTNKTMPERITVRHNTRIGKLSITEKKAGLLLPSDILEAEYVRADLVTGDANEPLKDGQYRWVGIMFSSEQWEVAQVFSLRGDFVFQVGRLSHRKDTVAKIGPVIRPPEGE